MSIIRDLWTKIIQKFEFQMNLRTLQTNLFINHFPKKYQEKIRYISVLVATQLLLLTTCEGGGNNNHQPVDDVSISIVLSLTMRIGETKSLTVTTQNTEFTLLTPEGSGCIKSGNIAVTCTPTTAGTYDVMVTATEDTTKKATATVNVLERENEMIVFQNFDVPVPPLNIADYGYPSDYYNSKTKEGGKLSISIDTTKKIAGEGSLKLVLTSGFSFYPQWNPYNKEGREFARSYIANPHEWKFNTYNRFQFWFWMATNGAPEQTDGTSSIYMGTYVKRVTSPNRLSDEDGGNHYYHPFTVARGQWSMCVMNSHPGHKRGNSGQTDTGNVPYPTTPEYGGSGDPIRTYNYFDTLTRFYFQEVEAADTSFPRTYWFDEMIFYREPAKENDEQVYSICTSVTPETNRLFLTWRRPKDENAIKHEVRYAFSDIHTLGWDNATPAPNGTITPPGWQGYNGMVYDTTDINMNGQQVIYLAIKPQNSNVFSQVVFPLTNSSTPP